MNYPHQEKNYYPRSIMISSGIFLGFLLISYFILIGNPLQEFGTGGLIVNYGTTDEGMGDDFMSVEEPSMDPNANQTLPDKVVPDNTPAVVASQQASDKTIVTQDVEDAPAVVTKANKPNPTPVATPEKKESQPTVNPNALYTGKKNNASGTGDGTGTTPGNQGTLEGDPLSPDYGEGGSGFGNTSLSLENRRFTSPPRIEDNGQLAGRVAVEITVNRQGTIISARAGVRGSTLNDPVLWEKCEKAAMGAQLNQLEKAPQTQRGVIMFVFKVR
jgi:hypothetical protein